MAAHQRRFDKWKAEGGDTAARPAGGGLLPPPDMTVKRKRRRKKPEGAPTQTAIKHPWSYLVLWYEELRRHTPRGLALESIGFPAIDAYNRLFQLDMEPWEVDTLMKLDVAWFSTVPKKPKS